MTENAADNVVRLPVTPPQIVGPFYPLGQRPVAGDLVGTGHGTATARGELLLLTGRVLTPTGQPVAGARIDIWQANADGKYRHPSDVNPAPVDPNFNGFAQLMTDPEGRYRLRTIKPGRYPTREGDIRPPHIHFAVDGLFDRLVTQLYFSGEPENQSDRWLNAAPRPEQLIVMLRHAPAMLDRKAWLAEFDIVIASG